MRVNKSTVDKHPFLYPPLPEQRRIVAKIEELFSNLDAGMDDLQAAGQQLERYRLSVLQAAVEGRLTADWRRTHDPEPADRLLERVEEKETVNKYKNRGKLTEPDADLMYEIPETWKWVQIGDLASAIRYGTSDKAKKENKGVPMLRMGDIEHGELHYDDLKYLPEDWEDKQKFLLRDGDVLFNRTNSAELVGKTAVYKDSHPEAVFASYLVRARLYLDVYTPDLMAYYINSVQGRKYINSVVSQQVGQANVNATKMASMPIPLPPLAEQKQIVDEVERLLSVANDAAATAEREHIRADRLRQSILKQAFSGRLVPHDEDATSPAIEASSSNGTGHDSSGSTGSSHEEDSSGEDDVIAEELYNDGDPGKQIEMDL
jgi:type I restriction enzyme S subunit